MSTTTKPFMRVVNWTALALMFVFLSLFGGQTSPVLSADTTVDPCCIEGDDGCSEDGAWVVDYKHYRAAGAAEREAAMVSAYDQSRQNSLKNADSQTNYWGDVKNMKCFSLYKNFMDAFAELLKSPINVFLDYIKSTLWSILDGVCGLAVDVINNALNSICIPMPSIGLPEFGIDGPELKYCDGVSAGDFIGAKVEDTRPDWIDDLPSADEVYDKIPYIREVEKSLGQ